MELLRATISPSILSKADRLFCNDDRGIFTELLQNARRAGATRVEVTIEASPEQEHVTRVTFEDNGHGIEDFQKLLTLGDSNWNPEVLAIEDPAGTGFFSLCHSTVEVSSGERQVLLTREVFLGQTATEIVPSDRPVHGTRIVFTRPTVSKPIEVALKDASEFNPLDVVLNGERIERHDFLEGALHREVIDGIEVGISTQFRRRFGWDRDDWNFHGSVLREPFGLIHGLLARDEKGEWREELLYLRFDVLEVGRVKLQLPDRRAIVQDSDLEAFKKKVRAAVYRFLSTQEHHVLSFEQWKEAQSLGVFIAEASPYLTTWHAQPADQDATPFFGQPETRLLPTLEDVLLADADLPNQHTLEAALTPTAVSNMALYQVQPRFRGYSWYDRLPTLTEAEVLVDGVLHQEREEDNTERPREILVKLTIEQQGHEDMHLDLPAAIHVLDGMEVFDGYEPPSFLAVRDSPWDNETLSGPFDVAQYLVSATFSPGDDVECDSYETQRHDFERHVDRVVNEYFRGPRAALMAALEDCLSWEARRYAEQAGVKEIRFRKQEETDRGWALELA